MSHPGSIPTIWLLFADLGEVLFGCLCVSHLQSGHPRPVQRLDVAWLPLQHPQAVLQDPSGIHLLFLQQTG